VSHAHFTLLVAVLFIGGITLMALALSGYGTKDRSHQSPPRLPGHDVQDRLNDTKGPGAT
jgi:hypothetical protein